MANENVSGVMSVESLQMKIENQQNIINQLSNENEELYQQYSHLMIRNNKYLKRIDDLQAIIDDLHIRIEELQLINGNMLKLNDRIRTGKDTSFEVNDNLSKLQVDNENINDDLKSITEFNNVFSHWKNYPEQDARNEPNLRKQVQMLIQLHHHKALRAADLFAKTGVGGVTGARYVAALKRFGLIHYTGARKKGQYVMTQKGIDFLEEASRKPIENVSSTRLPQSSLIQPVYPVIEEQGIPLKDEARQILASTFNQADL